MHIAFFTHTYPALNSNGGAEICYTMLKELQDRQIKVSLFIYAVDEYYKDCIDNYDKIKKLAENVNIFNASAFGTKKAVIKSFINNPLNFFSPENNLILPSFNFEKETHELLDSYKPDKIFIYDWFACPPAYKYNLEKMLVVGDLLFFPHVIGLKHRKLLGFEETFIDKFKLKNLRTLFGSLWGIYHRKKMQKKLFSNCDYGGSFGKYDAEWLYNSGINISKYYPTPYYDTSKKEFLDYENRVSQKNKKYKIATSLGRLHATATSSGLYLLYNDILPILNEKLGKDNFEIHIFGDGYLRGSLKKLENLDNVKIRGYVDDIDSELLSSDVFLLATNVHLGYRCRLLNCLARALPIVLHKNDTLNQPEFINEENCMIGNNSNELVDSIIKVLKDQNLKKKLMEGARQTYLDNFYPSKAVEKILNEFKIK